MDYRLFIARRYLASRKQVSLISVITGISVAGVALGVAALIVVLSVMNGFYDVVRDLLVSMDPHVRVVSSSGRGVTEMDAQELATVALEMPHVLSATAYVEGKALMIHEGSGAVNRVVIVRGVDPNSVRAEAIMGRFDLAGGGIVMGLNLGQRLGLLPASSGAPAGQVTLFSAQGLGQMVTRIFAPPQINRFEVRGLFSLEETYDNTHVFVGMAEAQRLFHMSGAVSGVEVRLDGLQHAKGIKRALEQALGEKAVRVETWYDLQKSLYDVMRLEKWGASLVLILISIVAAFNIVGSLTMVVIEKRRDVGVLQAMGAAAKDIRRIFLIEGALIGILGAGSGFVLGVGLSLMQKYFQLVPLAGAESFVIDAYPVAIRPLDLALIGAVSFGLCLLASVYPAWRAARVPAAQAVQMDR